MPRGSAPDAAPAPPDISVMVVDDHEMVADSIARALSSRSDMEVVAIAGTAADALTLAVANRPDVVILDHHLPDGDGPATAVALRGVVPDVRIVLLTGHLDDRLMLMAIEAGCSGFLSKERAVDDLVTAVRVVSSGEAYIPAGMLGRLLPRLPGGHRRAGVGLTRRELDVLGLLANGRSNRAIAADLTLSVNTIRNHVQTILTKLGAHSKLEAVVIAAREGIIRTE